MRAKIKWFLMLRKQNDMVKIVCLLILAGMVCFGNVCYHVWGICQYVNTSAEYVLTATGEETVSESRVEELRLNTDITGISREREQTLDILYGGIQTSITCTVLEKAYMEKRFGKKSTSGSKRFYMNESAFSEIQQAVSEGNGAEAGRTDGEIDIRYSETEESGEFKTAKLVVLKNEEPGEESFIYTAEASGRLQKAPGLLRVWFDKHDLDGLQVEQLGKLGYEIKNETEIIREKYEIQNKLIHIWSGLFSCGICLLGVIAGRKEFKKC